VVSRLEALQTMMVSRTFGITTFVLAVSLAVVLSIQGSKVARGTKYTPVSLEFSWTARKAEKILKAWGEEGIRRAKIQVLTDFLFIVSYSGFLCFFGWRMSRLALEQGDIIPPKIAYLAGWLGLAAGAADVLENCGLLAMLSGTRTYRIPLLTSIFASTKFALIALSLGGSGVVPIRYVKWWHT
jgi:hypothetical protein